MSASSSSPAGAVRLRAAAPNGTPPANRSSRLLAAGGVMPGVVTVRPDWPPVISTAGSSPDVPEIDTMRTEPSELSACSNVHEAGSSPSATFQYRRAWSWSSPAECSSRICQSPPTDMSARVPRSHTWKATRTSPVWRPGAAATRGVSRAAVWVTSGIWGLMRGVATPGCGMEAVAATVAGPAVEPKSAATVGDGMDADACTEPGVAVASVLAGDDTVTVKPSRACEATLPDTVQLALDVAAPDARARYPPAATV